MRKARDNAGDIEAHVPKACPFVIQEVQALGNDDVIRRKIEGSKGPILARGEGFGGLIGQAAETFGGFKPRLIQQIETNADGAIQGLIAHGLVIGVFRVMAQGAVEQGFEILLMIRGAHVDMPQCRAQGTQDANAILIAGF